MADESAQPRTCRPVCKILENEHAQVPGGRGYIMIYYVAVNSTDASMKTVLSC